MIDWPTSLVEDIARRKCVIFLGAGVSKNSTNAAGNHPKTWREFLEAGLLSVHDKSDKKVIKKNIDNNDYLMACELLKRSMGRDEFVRLLRAEFQTPRFEPAEIHKDIFLLDSRIVITPNFDKIYDTYATSESQGTTNIKYYYDTDIADHIRQNERLILKIHGCISTPDKSIFSKLDYANARSQYEFFYEILAALILTHTFVFIGAGINDPDIRLLFEDYYFKYKIAKKHQFIIPKKSISEQEIKVYEECMNLNMIQYDFKNNHRELLESIHELVRLVDEKRHELVSMGTW